MQQAELIIAYLRGELSGSQAQDFAQQLATEPDLQAALRDYQIILEGFKGIRHETFQREVAAWDIEAEPDDEGLQILAYLEGRLSASDHALWEQRMANEPELAQAVAAYRELMQGFKGLRQDNFAAEVGEWAKDLPDAAPQPAARMVNIAQKKNNGWRYAAAAVLLALVAASIWLLNPFEVAAPSLTAFREKSYIDPAIEIIRGEEEILSEAARSYARKEYAAAAAILETITAQDSLFVTARYLQGHSYYQLAQYQQAVTALTQSLEPPPGVAYDLRDFNRDNAAWTRILAQLALTKSASDASIQQDFQAFFSTFMQQADRSDTYYTEGLELQKLLKE